MLRAACRMRCSFSTSAIRTKPSPPSPKPVPGDTATSAFSTRSLENSMLPSVLNGSGIGDQANMEGAGGGTDQPVPAALVGFAHLADAVVRTVERRGRRDLDRSERAIVEVGFHPAQRRDD